MRTRHQPAVPQGASRESPEGLYTLILLDRRNASGGRMHRDHAPPDRTAYAAPRHSDSPRARAAPQPGRPVPPECPAVPPSCLSDSPRLRHVYQPEENRGVFTPLSAPPVATSFPDARCPTISDNNPRRGDDAAFSRDVPYRPECSHARPGTRIRNLSDYNARPPLGGTATGISRARTRSKWELY